MTNERQYRSAKRHMPRGHLTPVSPAIGTVRPSQVMPKVLVAQQSPVHVTRPEVQALFAQVRIAFYALSPLDLLGAALQGRVELEVVGENQVLHHGVAIILWYVAVRRQHRGV